jgi:hypothetical protein
VAEQASSGLSIGEVWDLILAPHGVFLELHDLRSSAASTPRSAIARPNVVREIARWPQSLERPRSRHADHAHTIVDASRTEPPLRGLEAAALTEVDGFDEKRDARDQTRDFTA